MSRSLIIAPMPPRIAAKNMFSGVRERNIPTAKGVVKPKKNKRPAMNELKYPKFFITET